MQVRSQTPVLSVWESCFPLVHPDARTSQEQTSTTVLLTTKTSTTSPLTIIDSFSINYGNNIAPFVYQGTSTASPSTTTESPSTDNGSDITPSIYQASSAGTTEGILSSAATTNKHNAIHNKVEKKMNYPLYLSIGLLLLITVASIIAIIFLKKSKNLRKKCNSNNSMGLNLHQTAEENIYQISE
ncbi:uncharacterized protein LOC132405377 isoform X3 [Hypanus sabinus]|uniref:uncharacterized protein LOC132405377 isoform X3 n=1 Tax=Hypanus sabinus TaxID=79690 RepID=UPI0028C4CFB9|nr:uncharacterized protein LOC132405377 isoform X3 [Hypanus sabinus]